MPTYITVNKFGKNADVDTGATPEDVWVAGGVYPFPAVARQLTMRSTSADDDGAGMGSGAWTAQATYLDDAFNEYNVSGTLAGTSLVNLGTVAAYRINRAFILTPANQVNAGTLLFECGGTVVGQIDVGKGQTQQLIYTVPANCKFAELHDYVFGIGRKTTQGYAEAEIQARPNGFAWRTQMTVHVQATGNNTAIRHWDLGYGPSYLPGTDLRGRIVDVSADDSHISGELSLRLVVGANFSLGA